MGVAISSEGFNRLLGCCLFYAKNQRIFLHLDELKNRRNVVLAGYIYHNTHKNIQIKIEK